MKKKRIKQKMKNLMREVKMNRDKILIYDTKNCFMFVFLFLIYKNKIPF